MSSLCGSLLPGLTVVPIQGYRLLYSQKFPNFVNFTLIGKMFTLSFVKYCIEDMFHYFNESQLRLVKFFEQQKVSGCIGTNKGFFILKGEELCLFCENARILFIQVMVVVPILAMAMDMAMDNSSSNNRHSNMQDMVSELYSNKCTPENLF